MAARGWSARPTPREVVRYETRAAGRADPRRHQEARPDRRGRGTGSPATAEARRKGRPAGSTCSSRSTTPADSASRRLPRRDRRQRASPSSTSSSASTAATGSRRARAHRQRQLLQTPLGRRLRRTDRRQEDARPTGRRQTAKPNASSAPCSSAGPTPTPTTTNTSAERARPRPRLLQSLPSTPRPRRPHTAPARQQPLWDKQLAPPRTCGHSRRRSSDRTAAETQGRTLVQGGDRQRTALRPRGHTIRAENRIPRISRLTATTTCRVGQRHECGGPLRLD